ncbi:MAG: hypothetical protein ACE5GD_06050 [Candidatus Geothermarchaeales archaeon]
MTPEERILALVERTSLPLSFEKIHADSFSDIYISRQRLKNILYSLLQRGEIEKKLYTIRYSDNPRIETVIAEIYFTKKAQVTKYEEEILPELMLKAKESLAD